MKIQVDTDCKPSRTIKTHIVSKKIQLGNILTIVEFMTVIKQVPRDLEQEKSFEN